MNSYINKNTIAGALATMAGMFLYKHFASNKVNTMLHNQGAK